ILITAGLRGSGMLLVRLVFALVLWSTTMSRSLLTPSPPDPDGDAPGDTADAAGQATPDSASDSEASDDPDQPAAEAAPNDGRKDRAPWLVRMGIAAAPLLGLIFFTVAVLALIDQNTDWRMPIGGG